MTSLHVRIIVLVQTSRQIVFYQALAGSLHPLMIMSTRAEDLQQKFEPRPSPQNLTGDALSSALSSSGVDYEPHPEHSIPVTSERTHIVKCISNLYSGSASEEDMKVYAEEAIYDDPWSYCDTRYKIAGQWYGMWTFFFRHASIEAHTERPNYRHSYGLQFQDSRHGDYPI